MSEQKYRPLKAGEILSNGDQFFTVDGRWVDYTADRWGTSISQYATGRRPVAGEQQEPVEYRSLEAGEIIQDGDQFFYDGEWVAYPPHRWGTAFNCATQARRPIPEHEQPAEGSSPTLDDALRSNTELAEKLAEITRERDDAITLHAVAESNCRELMKKYDASRKEVAEITRQRDELQKAYDSSRDCLVQSNLIVQDGQKAKAELEASQRMYMEAMKSLEREVVQHRETNRTLDEVCRERDALQEQLKERAGEPRKAEILDFLGVQIAVIPYLQAAVNKDAQRELTIAGRTLQMVHAAIESDRIGRPGEGEGKEVDGGKE